MIPHPMTLAIQADLQKLADPAKAAPMQAYMKTEQPFYGVTAGPRRKSFKANARSFKAISRAEYEQIIGELWAGTYREEMYQALEVVDYYQVYCDKESWPLYERLVRTAPHWDTLDWLAGGPISKLVRRYRELEAILLNWSEDENFWVRRASLLAHLHHKAETNTDLLAETILKLCHEKEFFIRKAIGWVLRDYSYSNPAWVKDFVAEHAGQLSGLSRREALKGITREGL